MKISALDNNGNIKEYNVILTYHNDKYNKDYVVYKSITVDNGNTTDTRLYKIER